MYCLESLEAQEDAAARKRAAADVQTVHEGSQVKFVLKTNAAHIWLRENVNSAVLRGAQLFRDSLFLEKDFAGRLSAVMRRAGLKLS